MNKIPTAEEFFMEYLDVDCDFMESMREQLDKCSGFNFDIITDIMLEFAKLHVQAALEAASYNAEITWDALPVIGDFQIIDKDSILTAYPLENIK